MFSGIVEGMGEIVKAQKAKGGIRLRVKTALDFSDVKVGDSVSVEGVCLTVVGAEAEVYDFDVVAETLRKTTLGKLRKGSKVNIERSLKVGDRISGHFVGGHVDGKVRLLSRLRDGASSIKMRFAFAQPLRRFLVAKGSVALAGVSLTVGEVGNSEFWVYLIPHTLELTTLGAVKIGNEVNLEVDMLARYVLEAKA